MANLWLRDKETREVALHYFNKVVMGFNGEELYFYALDQFLEKIKKQGLLSERKSLEMRKSLTKTYLSKNFEEISLAKIKNLVLNLIGDNNSLVDFQELVKFIFIFKVGSAFRSNLRN